jgi:predicted enzyme related to lactoylglutathione lyase
MAKRAKVRQKKKSAARRIPARVEPIPAGYQRAFGAVETVRMPGADGTTVGLFLYVRDVNSAFKRAADAGGTVLKPLEDTFWGDRFGSRQDPFGNQWSMATHQEDVPPKEMARRAQAAMAQMPGTSS